MNLAATPALLLLLLAPLHGRSEEDRGPRNPLYDELRRQGVAIADRDRVKLPEPVMNRGLDAGGQKAVLERLGGARYPLDELLRNAVVAPYLLEVHEASHADRINPAYRIDVYFVAHGKLEVAARRSFLESFEKKQKDHKLHLLTPEELRQRRLSVRQGGGVEERYSHTVFNILERVQLSAATHSFLSRSKDSLLSASVVDERFQNDEQYGSRWRSMTADGMGGFSLGEAHPYRGAGGYVQVLRLHEPAGALFVEYHLIYVEPHGWFKGANPLRSKLHSPVQAQVRSFRRELARASR